MKNEKMGLVLEGGGMRGVYTSGVLEAFMEKKIEFPYIIGVSAGANNGAGFIAQQKTRSKKVFVNYASHKDFSGIKHWIRNGNYLNMDFIYHTLANELLPFDYDAFLNSDTTFKVCVTNASTGKPEYFTKAAHKDIDFIRELLKASSSIPILTKPVQINGSFYFDGGISDSIPLEKSVKDGNRSHVVVLTRTRDYRKEKQALDYLLKYMLVQYPEVSKALQHRHIHYNQALDKIELLEKRGELFVFRPSVNVNVTLLEKRPAVLERVYNQGYWDTMNKIHEFQRWTQKRATDAARFH